jgi:hypothetical protein
MTHDNVPHIFRKKNLEATEVATYCDRRYSCGYSHVCLFEAYYTIENFEYGMREFAIYDNNGYMLQFGHHASHALTSASLKVAGLIKEHLCRTIASHQFGKNAMAEIYSKS